jgi:hypothetical protein
MAIMQIPEFFIAIVVWLCNADVFVVVALDVPARRSSPRRSREGNRREGRDIIISPPWWDSIKRVQRRLPSQQTRRGRRFCAAPVIWNQRPRSGARDIEVIFFIEPLSSSSSGAISALFEKAVFKTVIFYVPSGGALPDSGATGVINTVVSLTDEVFGIPSISVTCRRGAVVIVWRHWMTVLITRRNKKLVGLPMKVWKREWCWLCGYSGVPELEKLTKTTVRTSGREIF